jgi:hypothetical protein
MLYGLVGDRRRRAQVVNLMMACHGVGFRTAEIELSAHSLNSRNF